MSNLFECRIVGHPGVAFVGGTDHTSADGFRSPEALFDWRTHRLKDIGYDLTVLANRL